MRPVLPCLVKNVTTGVDNYSRDVIMLVTRDTQIEIWLNKLLMVQIDLGVVIPDTLGPRFGVLGDQGQLSTRRVYLHNFTVTNPSGIESLVQFSNPLPPPPAPTNSDADYKLRVAANTGLLTWEAI